MAVEQDITLLGWTPVLEAHNIDEKVITNHNMINSIVDQHCPLRKIKVGEEKSPRGKTNDCQLRWTKTSAFIYKRENPSWKFLGQLLSLQNKKKIKNKYSNQEINNAISCKQWWQNIRNLEKNKDLSPEMYNIDSNWLSPS